jgi:hypothetical protein
VCVACAHGDEVDDALERQRSAVAHQPHRFLIPGGEHVEDDLVARDEERVLVLDVAARAAQRGRSLVGTTCRTLDRAALEVGRVALDEERAL